jgi:hypothetical protein
MIDERYGHLARDSEDALRARLDAEANVVALTWRRTRAATEAIWPGSRASRDFGEADDGARTRDPWLGKPMLYQLSYVRLGGSTIPLHFEKDRRGPASRAPPSSAG